MQHYGATEVHYDWLIAFCVVQIQFTGVQNLSKIELWSINQSKET